MVIEIDGIQHGYEENLEKDKQRDKYFFHLGIKVLRYTNSDINKRFNSVCEDILSHLGLTVNDLKP